VQELLLRGRQMAIDQARRCPDPNYSLLRRQGGLIRRKGTFHDWKFRIVVAADAETPWDFGSVSVARAYLFRGGSDTVRCRTGG
jgi:hypothetical protein